MWRSMLRKGVNLAVGLTWLGLVIISAQMGEGLLSLSIALLPVAIVLGSYALALSEIFFFLPQEGTASGILKGGSIADIIGVWKGWYLNRPGFPGYDPVFRDYERMPYERGRKPPTYHFWLWNWLADTFGIYYIGLFPMRKIDWYTFEWTETQSKVVDGKTVEVDWPRKLPTNFIYLSRFTYRFTLKAAEDKTGKPMDLHYALTLEVNNPYVARYVVVDWLKRINADSLDVARGYAGQRAFQDIVGTDSQNKATIKPGESEAFSWVMVDRLNNDLPSNTNQRKPDGGAPKEYGIIVSAADLLQVELTGSNVAELAKATQAVGIAQAYADAKVVTAEGDAKAIKLVADAETYRAKSFYGELDQHPNSPQFEKWGAVREAAGKGATVVVSDGGGNTPVLINPSQNSAPAQPTNP